MARVREEDTRELRHREMPIESGSTLRQTYSGVTGTSQTYTALQRFTDDKDGSKTVVFRITPINGSYQGTVRDTDAFLMTGFGMALGLGFGGHNA